MTVRTIVRGAGRVAIALIAAGVIGVFGMQFEEILAKNVTLAQDVAQSRARATELRDRIVRERRTIDRLRDPAGTMPEIHDELKLLGPHEEIIYVRGAPARTPAPDTWSDR